MADQASSSGLAARALEAARELTRAVRATDANGERTGDPVKSYRFAAAPWHKVLGIVGNVEHLVAAALDSLDTGEPRVCESCGSDDPAICKGHEGAEWRDPHAHGARAGCCPDDFHRSVPPNTGAPA